MNIYLHELKAYKKTTIIWTISICLIFIMFMSMFSAFKEGEEAFMKLLSGYSEDFLKAFGVPKDLFNFLNFFSYIFLYVALCGSIQAMNLGLSIISKEIRNKTADFLITKPVSRMKIIVSKTLAGLTLLILTNLIVLTVTTLMAKLSGEEFDFSIFIKMNLSLIFLQLIFFSLGILIAVLTKKIKNVVAISTGIVFSLYVIGMLQTIMEKEVVRYLVPFKYLDFQYIIANGKYETNYLVFGLVISTIFILSSYIIYKRKDVHAV